MSLRISHAVKLVLANTSRTTGSVALRSAFWPSMPSTMDQEPQHEPVYFWRETDGKTGWLSQWYYCPFRDDEDSTKIYKTAEHYMMHHKALLFNDQATAKAILSAGHPRNVKALGRKVKPFSETVWNQHREAIVQRGTRLKFTQAVSEDGGFRMGTSEAKELPLLEGSLREMLLRTGEREIVEASPYDAIWGIGFVEAHAEEMREQWGLNLLGKALMSVRRELREEKEQKQKQK